MFNSTVQILKVKTSDVLASIEIKIASRIPTTEHKAYFFCIEYVKEKRFVSLNTLYWIDRYRVASDDEDGTNVSIRQNKTITLRLNLLSGVEEDGRMVSSIRLHFKEYAYGNENDKDVWVSNILCLSTKKLLVGTLTPVYVTNKDSSMKVYINHNFDSAIEKSNFNIYCIPKVELMDKTCSFVLDTVTAYSITDSGLMKFISTCEETFTKKASYLRLKIETVDGSVLYKKDFKVDSLLEMPATKIGFYGTNKIINSYYIGKGKNFIINNCKKC